MKAITIGGAMVDTIAIIESDRIERMAMLNADTSFLLLEEGRKTEALDVSTHCGGGAINTAVAMSRLGLDVGEGVYGAWLGPQFETPAEIRYLRAIGCDLAGMSTVPEVIAARHLGVRCLGISVVTNMAAGITEGKLGHEEVLEVGAEAGPRLTALLRELLPTLAA